MYLRTACMPCGLMLLSWPPQLRALMHLHISSRLHESCQLNLDFGTSAGTCIHHTITTVLCSGTGASAALQRSTELPDSSPSADDDVTSGFTLYALTFRMGQPPIQDIPATPNFNSIKLRLHGILTSGLHVLMCIIIGMCGECTDWARHVECNPSNVSSEFAGPDGEPHPYFLGIASRLKNRVLVTPNRYNPSFCNFSRSVQLCIW